MLIDEAKISARLQHANIVQIYDLGKLEGQYFIAMEYINGVDLVQLLSRLRKSKSRIPLELVCFIMSEALKGLDYAHRAMGPDGDALGIVHRDFNPANILLSFQGEVKVADFGIAMASDRGTKTIAGGLKGKMGYLSPEQVLGQPLDHRSDVFTAGITLWEMLTNRRMFPGGTELDTLLKIRDALIPDIKKYLPDLDESLIQILGRAMQRKPEDRFQTAGLFKEELDDFLFDRGIKVSASQLEEYLKGLFPRRNAKESASTDSVKVDATVRKAPNYWLRGPGLRTIGPIDIKVLGEMILGGEINKEHEVLREGGNWRHVGELPELAAFAPGLDRGLKKHQDTEPTYYGKIAEVSFAKLFYRLAIAKENGRLLLKRPGVRKDIFIRQGMPEFVDSNLPTERLGEYLISHNVITSQQRDQAVKAMQGFSGRLGDTLVGLRILEPHRLFESLQEQVREKILEVFSWTAGEYSFFTGQLYEGEVMPLKVGSYALIVEGIRKYAADDVLKNRYRSTIDKAVKRIENRYLSLANLNLSAREQRVVDCVDGERSVRELLMRAGAGRDDFEKEVYRVLYILDELEMLAFS